MSEYLYDPGMVLTENYIEETFVVEDLAIPFLINSGFTPFYKNDLGVIGIDSDGVETPLNYPTGYSLSPEYITVSAATGKAVFSFILVPSYSKFISIKIKRHFVGCIKDFTLMRELTELSETMYGGDLTLIPIEKWYSLNGEEVNLRASSLSPVLNGLSVWEVIAKLLKDIKDLSATPEAYNSSVLLDYTAKLNELAILKAILLNNIAELQNKINTIDSFVASVDVSLNAKPTFSWVANQLLNKADLIAGLVPYEQLPPLNNDTIMYNDMSEFPVVGVFGKFYYDISTGLTYAYSTSTNEYVIKIEALGGGTPTPVLWKVIADNFYQVKSGDKLLLDCSVLNITLQLPLVPDVGEEIELKDYKSSSAIKNFYINSNGKKIQGLLDDWKVSENSVTLKLVYTGDDYGWSIIHYA